MNEHAVVIAGGGPTGLMLAGELALAGTDVVIVERRTDQEVDGSRAGGLHSRTIEVLDQRGIAERFLSAGDVMQTQGFAYIPLDISVDLGAKTLTGDEMLIISVVPFVIAFIAWFLLKTDAGVAVRAAAENADRALLYGIPIKRLSTIVWVIAGSLSDWQRPVRSKAIQSRPGATSLR